MMRPYVDGTVVDDDADGKQMKLTLLKLIVI